MSFIVAALRTGSKQKRARANTIRERGVHGPSPGTVTITDSYTQLRKIGEGGQGKLWVVKRKSDKKIFVRKEQKRYEMHGSVPCEMYIFESVLSHHPRIIELDHANYIGANGCLVLYFEHCEGGDLSRYMPRHGERGVPEGFLWNCFTQLAEAVAFLHHGYNRFSKHPNVPPRNWKRIVHRDIKPANVFLRNKMTSEYPVPQLVLGDFGLATLDEVTYGCGTDEWIGPEIPIMTKEGDVWSVGAIVHALAHGKGPVGRPQGEWARSEHLVDKWYRLPGARQPRQLSSAYSGALNRNMMDCLVREPKGRVSSLQLAKNLEKQRPRGGR